MKINNWFMWKLRMQILMYVNNLHEYPIRSPLQQNEHCPVCDEHVPDVRFTGSVLELEQIDEDTWILADGSIAVEDGHGGLMVSLCIDCATEHDVLKKRNWCTKTLV